MNPSSRTRFEGRWALASAPSSAAARLALLLFVPGAAEAQGALSAAAPSSPAAAGASAAAAASTSEDDAAGGRVWAKNDPNRPQPPVVEPRGAILGLPPPSDAVVLFDGRNMDAFEVPAGSGWSVENGRLRAGGRVFNRIVTRRRFADLQMHLEFRTPFPPKGEGQHRGNSGVFLMDRYEIQILDSVGNRTYADGTLGAVYGQTPPRVLAGRPPGEWQSLDILFRTPRGAPRPAPARVTVLVNGVAVQVDQAVPTATRTGAPAEDPAAPPREGPLALQDHGTPGDRLEFRNIWVRPLGAPAS